MIERLVLFSDVHLSPSERPKTEALLAFLERVRGRGVSQLVCLGDLFHYWVGAGHEREPAFQAAIEALAGFAADGVPLTFVHGNRDFLVDRPLADRLGRLAIIPDGCEVRGAGARLYVAHGDLLCARDTRYRAMRRFVRADSVRRLFGALPLATRLRIGGGIRGISRRQVAAKSTRTLSLAPGAIRRLFQDGIDAAVVGHVHRAQRITLRVRGRERLLLTLGAWDHGNASWLEIEAGRYRLFDGPEGCRVLEGALPSRARSARSIPPER